MPKTYTAFTPADTAILLVDHQPGVLQMGGSLPAELVTRHAATLAKLGEDLNIPLVITTTRENLEFLGTTLPAIQTAAPKAFENRIIRGGTLNAFVDPAFNKTVADTGRRNLVIAGLLTDVCLFNTVTSAVAAGYNVLVAADASSTSTVLADTVTYARLRSLGVQAVSTWGILFELFSDLNTPEGQQAEAVASSFVS